LDKLPHSIVDLVLLTEIEASGNQIATLPEDFGKLGQLVRVFLRQNRIIELPSFVGLSQLVELYLGVNEIRQVPPSIGDLPQLKTLDLADNSIENLPVEITKLSELKRLDVRNNRLDRVPPELGLMDLQSLGLDGNPLRSIKRTILNQGTVAILQYLRYKIPKAGEGEEKENKNPFLESLHNGTLDLSKKHLDKVSLQVFQLDKMIKLQLNQNGLEEIPSEIEKVNNLQVLDISENKKMRALPASLGKLTKLSEIYLKCNSFGCLPTPICELVSLKILDIQGNRITELPKEIVQLTNLTELHLDFNKLKEIPCTITTLTVLHLSNNNIGDINLEILKMTSLTDLDLSCNDLTNIPPQLGMLTTLKKLSVDGNRIRSIRRTIIAKGTEALLEYLRFRIPVL